MSTNNTFGQTLTGLLANKYARRTAWKDPKAVIAAKLNIAPLLVQYKDARYNEDIFMRTENGMAKPYNLNIKDVMATDWEILDTDPANTIPAPTSLVIGNADITIAIGETAQIMWQVLPTGAPQKATFSSATEATATVDASGVVTAVDEGTSVITVTSATGSKTDTITVTVTA